MYDNITKPAHYGWHPSGVEAKEVTDDLPHWLGDAITYIWRRNHKGQPIDDRRKAITRLNEATPERLYDVWLSVSRSAAVAASRVGREPDHILYLACQLVQVADKEHRSRPLAGLVYHLKGALQAELDELTANEPRTPTIYEEQ